MPEEQVVDTTESREVIAPGYTFGTVTDQIAAVVMTRHTPLFWFGAFVLGFMLIRACFSRPCCCFGRA
jgi:hypothetical protein